MKRNLIIVFILFAFTSCATLPKETVEMSVMLEQQISTLETTTISITDKYFEEQQKKAVDFLDNEWYPYFLNQFFKSDKVIIGCDDMIKDTIMSSKIEKMKILTEAVQGEYMLMRDYLFVPINKTHDELITEIRTEFQLAKTINNSMTNNISSISQLQEKRKEVFSKIVDYNKLQAKMDTAILKVENILNNAQVGLNLIKQNDSTINNMFHNK